MIGRRVANIIKRFARHRDYMRLADFECVSGSLAGLQARAQTNSALTSGMTRVVIYSNIQGGFMRRTTFAIGLVSLAVAVSASVLAQTSADTTGKKTPAVQTAESQAAMTPASALKKLKKDNARFVEKNMRSRDWLAKVSATAGGQYPFAAILACMDSRTPFEIIFDQGIGDVFGIRIAGNIVNEDVLGTWSTQRKSSERSCSSSSGTRHAGL
jgi:Carbonic anhydrase